MKMKSIEKTFVLLGFVSFPIGIAIFSFVNINYGFYSGASIPDLVLMMCLFILCVYLVFVNIYLIRLLFRLWKLQKSIGDK